MRRFTKEHEWVELSGKVATIGITDHAQDALGDVVFVDLPKIGRKVNANESVAVVESVKAASDIYSPFAGTILEINDKVSTDSSLVNTDAEGQAWFFKMELVNPDEFETLLDKQAYDEHVKNS